jgi:ribosome biogenesis GTPase A
MNWFATAVKKKQEPTPTSSIRVLILGSPNVGKSTLIYAIMGQQLPNLSYTPTYGCNLSIHVFAVN